MPPRLAEPVASRDPALTYRDDLVGAAERAMRASFPSVHDLRLGGAHVRLRLAGPALEPILLPALAHGLIERTGELPELSIDAWDSESTGVGPPAFPWRAEDVRERVLADPEGRSDTCLAERGRGNVVRPERPLA